MIGESVFYLDNNRVVTSKIANISRRATGVFVLLDSGAGFWKEDLCFSLQDLFKKLSREFKNQNC